MKKSTVSLIIFIAVLAAVLVYLCGWMTGADYDNTNTYEAPAIVTEVDEATGWVSFVDWNGETWCIRGEGYEVDQLVIAVFNDNATESIYDDLVVEVKHIEGTE